MPGKVPCSSSGEDFGTSPPGRAQECDIHSPTRASLFRATFGPSWSSNVSLPSLISSTSTPPQFFSKHATRWSQFLLVIDICCKKASEQIREVAHGDTPDRTDFLPSLLAYSCPILDNPRFQGEILERNSFSKSARDGWLLCRLASRCAARASLTLHSVRRFWMPPQGPPAGIVVLHWRPWRPLHAWGRTSYRRGCDARGT